MRFDFAITSTSDVLRGRVRRAGHWSRALFTEGDTGFTYDPSDVTSLFQDAAGTLPVVADGDPVGRMVDQSGKGHDALQTIAERRPLWRTDGIRGWLEFDGTDDEMTVPQTALSQTATSFVGIVALTANGYYPMILGDQSLSSGLSAGFGNGSGRKPRFGISGHNPVTLIAADALTLGQVTSMAYVWDGSNRVLLRDGREVGRDVQTATWVKGDQPLLCYSGSNVLKSSILFHGGLAIDRGLSGVELAKLPARLGQELPAAGTAWILGDSSIASYAGLPPVLGLLDGDRAMQDLAAPGQTIAQQMAAWTSANVTQALDGFVLIQLGLNDLDPSETANSAIGRLQMLVDTVRADIGSAPVLIAQMTPARQRLLDIYGAQEPAAQDKWLAINAAIAGQGTTPVTGVDARITTHVAAMDDGTGALAADFDTGDGIHPNTAGRQLIADAWRAGLNGLDLSV